jgi:hypothetical protein
MCRLRHRKEDEPTASEVYIGPITYRRFMETFHRIYASKSRERIEKVEKLKLVCISQNFLFIMQ